MLFLHAIVEGGRGASKRLPTSIQGRWMAKRGDGTLSFFRSVSEQCGRFKLAGQVYGQLEGSFGEPKHLRIKRQGAGETRTGGTVRGAGQAGGED